MFAAVYVIEPLRIAGTRTFVPTRDVSRLPAITRSPTLTRAAPFAVYKVPVLARVADVEPRPDTVLVFEEPATPPVARVAAPAADARLTVARVAPAVAVRFVVARFVVVRAVFARGDVLFVERAATARAAAPLDARPDTAVTAPEGTVRDALTRDEETEREETAGFDAVLDELTSEVS